jgi:hypothetical protein
MIQAYSTILFNSSEQIYKRSIKLIAGARSRIFNVWAINFGINSQKQMEVAYRINHSKNLI